MPDVQLSDNQHSAGDSEVELHVSRAAAAVPDHQGSAGVGEGTGCLLCCAGRTRLSLSRHYVSASFKGNLSQTASNKKNYTNNNNTTLQAVIVSGFERKHSGTHSENPAALHRAAARRLFSDVLKLFDLDPQRWRGPPSALYGQISASLADDTALTLCKQHFH